MQVSVSLDEAGPGDIPVLRRLMQLYLSDLGTVDGWDIGGDGLYGNAERTERFWSESGRRYRRRGVGTRVATMLFDRLPGAWEVVEMAP